MRMSKALLAMTSCLLAAGATPALAQACNPRHTFTTVDAGYLTAATIVYAPYSLIDDAGNASGIDGGLLHAIADLECLKVKTVPVDAAASVQYVLSGKSDTATGDWYRTAERAKVLNLSAPLYLDQMAIYSSAGWDKVSDLEGKPIGVLQGSLWNADLKKILGDNLKFYPTAVGLAQDLEAGRVAAFVEGTAFGAVAKQKGELKDIKVVPVKPDNRVKASVGPGQGCFLINKANAGLLKAIDDDLAELKSKGTIEKLLGSYGLPPSAGQTGEPSLIQ